MSASASASTFYERVQRRTTADVQPDVSACVSMSSSPKYSRAAEAAVAASAWYELFILLLLHLTKFGIWPAANSVPC